MEQTPVQGGSLHKTKLAPLIEWLLRNFPAKVFVSGTTVMVCTLYHQRDTYLDAFLDSTHVMTNLAS